MDDRSFRLGDHGRYVAFAKGVEQTEHNFVNMPFTLSKYLEAKAALEECERDHHRILFVEHSTTEERKRIAIKFNECATAFRASFGWHELDDDSRDRIWNRLDDRICGEEEFELPKPCKTWDVGHVIDSYGKREVGFDYDLQRKCINVLKRPELRGLNWHVIEHLQHAWYRLCIDEMPDHYVEWPMDVFPCSDPFYLVNEEMTCGLISEVRGPVYTFGEPFFSAIHEELPLAFTNCIREW